jgi:lysyl-tRNA synthetase class 2
MLEFYWAYADYRDAMDLTEELMRELTQSVLGSTEVVYGDATFHFDRPFERMTVVEAILKHNPDLTNEDIAERDAAAAIAGRLGIKVEKELGPRQDPNRDFRGDGRSAAAGTHLHHCVSHRSLAVSSPQR